MLAPGTRFFNLGGVPYGRRVRARPNDHSQRTGPPSSADSFRRLISVPASHGRVSNPAPGTSRSRVLRTQVLYGIKMSKSDGSRLLFSIVALSVYDLNLTEKYRVLFPDIASAKPRLNELLMNKNILSLNTGCTVILIFNLKHRSGVGGIGRVGSAL